MDVPLWWSVPENRAAITQRRLCLPVTGQWDAYTVATVRGVQALASLPITGVVDEATAAALGPRVTDGDVPSWFTTGEGNYSDVVERLVGGEAGLRRFQSAQGLTPTGAVDEATARLLGCLEV